MQKIPRFLFVVLLFTTNFANAQNSSLATDANQMTELVNNWITEINKLPKNGSAEPLMRLFTQNFKNRVTIFDIDNKTRIENRDYVTTQQFYNRYTLSNIKADYRLVKIINSYTTDSIGYAIFEVEYDMYNAGTLYKQGIQSIAFQFVKNHNKKWQIEDATTFIRYKKLNKAPCSCLLYNRNAEYLATLQAPKGDDYVTEYHTIQFNTLNKTQKEVRVNGEIYIWTTEGKSLVTTPDKRTLTAKTQNEAEIINLILSDKYKEQCFSVNFQQ